MVKLAALLQSAKVVKLIGLAVKLLLDPPFRTSFMALPKFISRNLVSITFPVLTIAAIWADWSHTRKWKASLKQLQN